MEKRDIPGVHRYDAPAGGGARCGRRPGRSRSRCTSPITGIAAAHEQAGRLRQSGSGRRTRNTPPPSSSARTAPRLSLGKRPRRVTPEFFATYKVTALLQQSEYELENHGRITHPMAYDPASETYKLLEWDAAFARIGEVLRGLPSPEMAEFYPSGRASNEAAFLFNIFAREFGTNNFPDC